MRRLHERFADDLAIVGVHSPKFPEEKLAGHVRHAVDRLGVLHPVVNDPERRLWEAYAVRAWPTVVLIDGKGRIAEQRSGEIDEPRLAAQIAEQLARARPGGQASKPLPPRSQRPAHTDTLRYPTRVLFDGDELYVSDTGHHRVLRLELDAPSCAARIADIYGDATPGSRDGSTRSARFCDPRGLALSGSTLYVADSGNHCVRAIDVVTRRVRTVAGTGELADGFPVSGSGAPTEAPMRSPWALWVEQSGALLIAMAGSHQLWAMLDEQEIGPFAGNGREALVDGERFAASLNQPSDIASGLSHLFIADAEASAIRAITPDDEVITLVGRGLFVWGDRDGRGEEVRLQHPEGLAVRGSSLLIADSYNHKIKRLEPTTGEVTTLIGSVAGCADGPLSSATLHQPEGLAVSRDGCLVAIADTVNHRIRIADLHEGQLRTLRLLQA